MTKLVTYIKLVWKARKKQLLNALPFYSYRGYTPFLILGHPRTGTSLLHTYLNAHPGILSLNEVLSEVQDSQLLKKPYSKSIQAVGFKYFYEYTVEEAKRKVLMDLLTLEKIRIVRIHRKNYLRTFVSLKIAEKTKEWSQTENSIRSIRERQLMLTKEECIIAFHVYKKWEEETIELVSNSNATRIEVDYDELVDKPTEIMNAVQLFLGVKPKQLQSLLVRQNPENLTDLIRNYEVLKKEFVGTEYAMYFE